MGSLLLCSSFATGWVGAQAISAAAAPSRPMTMADAVARALAGNPPLRAAREHTDATRAAEATARVRQNPTLTLLGQGVTLPAVTPQGNPYFYSASVQRLFERGEKRRWRTDAAIATTAQTEAQTRDLERAVTLEVRQAFTNMLAAKAAREIAEENLRDYRKSVELSQARLDAGDIDRTDFERVDLQLAQFESDDDTARLQHDQASAALQLLFGVERPDLTMDVDGTLDVPAVALTQGEAEARALQSRPDYLAAQDAVRVATAYARLAVATGKSDPTLASEYERSGQDNTFGMSVALPLRIFDRNQGEKARTALEVRASEFARTAARNQVVNDVDQAWLALETNRRQTERFRTHYVEEAARVRDNLQFSYRNGNSTLLDYLDALRSYRAVRLAAVNSNAQVWLAIHQLSFATATDIVP